MIIILYVLIGLIINTIFTALITLNYGTKVLQGVDWVRWVITSLAWPYTLFIIFLRKDS